MWAVKVKGRVLPIETPSCDRLEGVDSGTLVQTEYQHFISYQCKDLTGSGMI